MYIKFCRSYGEAGANLSPETKLSVQLEGEKDEPPGGNTRLYRAMCVFLTTVCLVLLLIVIVLSVKLQTGYETQCSSCASMCATDQCRTEIIKLQAKDYRCEQCPEKWLRYEQSCFFLSTLRLDWVASQKYCSAKGGYLAVIDSTGIQHFLTNNGKLNYWIGLKREMNDEDRWTWINNTALIDSYWSKDVTNGDCGILSSEDPPENNWKKGSCKYFSYFICQM